MKHNAMFYIVNILMPIIYKPARYNFVQQIDKNIDQKVACKNNYFFNEKVIEKASCKAIAKG